MLTLEQIIELQEKGFTYEQLAVLNAMNLTTLENVTLVNEAKPENAVNEAKPENAVNEAKPEGAVNVAKPEDAVNVAKPEDALNEVKPAEGDELAKQIAELTSTVKAMQAQNVKQAMQEQSKPLTADDVIKSFMEAS